MDNSTPSTKPSIAAYEAAIGGIPECFDSLTGDSIRELSEYAASLQNGRYPAKEADAFIRAHFDMLSTWYDALDQLDSEIRGDVVEGSIPTWAQQYLKTEAHALFAAQQALLRAVAEYHHGTAGPLLDPEYGYAYQLSNSVLSPL
ncbi:hypothetical protein [Kitasatospora sp. NPDC001175]|uniref:hypothetical protein n=1 Tax=Kitasatospora sp. NPDC001175 TaxID=3157103 RepID=UPI003D03611F